MTAKELIQKLILGEVKLSQGLMLTKVLFKDRMSENSYQWICNELDHYEDASTMPEYRIVDCEVKVQIMVPYIESKQDATLNDWVKDNNISLENLLIPTGVSLDVSDFKLFVEERKKLLAKRLKKIIEGV